MSDLTFIGKTDWRESNRPFGIRDRDRLAHIYCIGKTGTGKSTLLMNMAISDIVRGSGFCVIDPHGDIADALLRYVPQSRVHDVIYFNATDTDYPVAFNPIYEVPDSAHPVVASFLIGTFKKIWAESWGPRLEHILRFALLTLLQYGRATLLDIQPLLTDTYFRNGVLNAVTDPFLLTFWKQEFDKYSPQLKSEAIAPILNKIGLLVASIPLRHILGQDKTLDIDQLMDGRKIVICNLAKGSIGEDAAALLGSMVLSAIQSAALGRSAQDPLTRVPFYLYVDEMQSFVTLAFVDMLAESRKFGLSLFLTHQYIEQLHEKVRAAIFGNVGTFISFRVGAGDAAYVAQEFYPVFTDQDVINLPRYAMYLKLMIDGATSKPFSATTLPLSPCSEDYSSEVIAFSRKHYATARELVEASLLKRSTKRLSHGSTLFDSPQER